MKHYNLISPAFVTVLLVHYLKFSSPYPLFSDYDSSGGSNKSYKSETFEPVQQFPKILSIITIEETADGGGKLMLNDPAKITVKKDEHGILMYTIDKDAKCVEIGYEEQGLKMKNSTIWKHDPKEDGNNFPRRIILNRQYRYISLVMRKEWVYNFEFDPNKSRFSLLSKRRLETKGERSERAAKRSRSAGRRPRKDTVGQADEGSLKELMEEEDVKKERDITGKKDAEVQTDRTTKDAETQTEIRMKDAETQVDMDAEEQIDESKEKAENKEGGEKKKDEEKKRKDATNKKKDKKEERRMDMNKIGLILICVLVPVAVVVILGIVGFIWYKSRS